MSNWLAIGLGALGYVGGILSLFPANTIAYHVGQVLVGIVGGSAAIAHASSPSGSTPNK